MFLLRLARRFSPLIRGAGWEESLGLVGSETTNWLTPLASHLFTCVTGEGLEVTVGQERPPLVVLNLQHQRHRAVSVTVPSLHSPRHVKADPAGLGGVHHLGVQHHHRVGGPLPGDSAARALQLQLGHRDADLLSLLAVRAELVQPQLGRVNADLSVRPAGGELDAVELRGDVGNARELGQQLVVGATCVGNTL